MPQHSHLPRATGWQPLKSTKLQNGVRSRNDENWCMLVLTILVLPRYRARGGGGGSYGAMAVCVCVCVRVPRESIQSCSNCEVQQSYVPTTTTNHKFIVLPCNGAAQEGRILSYVQSPPTHHGSCPKNPPRDIKTHIACSCALPLPTSPSHASLGRQGGGGLLGTHRQDKRLKGGHGCTVMSPPASQRAANHPTMEGKEKLGNGGGGTLTAESPG